MTIYQFIRDIDRTSGGPSFSVPSLCEALSKRSDTRVELIARHSKHPLSPAETTNLRCHLLHGNSRREIREHLDATAGQTAVAHINGLWDPFVHSAVSEARRRRLPIMISVRGMLERSAFAHKRWKKTAGWLLYQKKDLLSASVIHATSQSEVESIRRFGLNNPVVLLPNGVADPDPTGSDRAKDPVVLFLGRLHPIKGLDVLLDAWARNPRPGWTLQISGPDENGYERQLRNQARQLGLGDSVRLTGPLQGDSKRKALSQSSCLVLPSHSENFGMVVAEALSAGTPVAASTGTPWRELVAENAGWWVAPEPAAFSGVFDTVMALPERELRQMGERGRNLIRKNYAWPALINRYENVYRWMAGDTPRPKDVIAAD